MSFKKLLVTSVLYTLVTAVILGIGYPLLVTVVAHTLFRDKADGQLITINGTAGLQLRAPAMTLRLLPAPTSGHRARRWQTGFRPALSRSTRQPAVEAAQYRLTW
jgi:hypothetical protein